MCKFKNLLPYNVVVEIQKLILRYSLDNSYPVAFASQLYVMYFFPRSCIFSSFALSRITVWNILLLFSPSAIYWTDYGFGKTTGALLLILGFFFPIIKCSYKAVWQGREILLHSTELYRQPERPSWNVFVGHWLNARYHARHKVNITILSALEGLGA